MKVFWKMLNWVLEHPLIEVLRFGPGDRLQSLVAKKAQ